MTEHAHDLKFRTQGGSHEAKKEARHRSGGSVKTNMDLLDMVVKSQDKGWWSAGLPKSQRWRAVARTFMVLARRDIAIPEVIFSAPSVDIVAFSSGQLALPKNNALIYLAPMLEFESLEYVTHTVAHELAHVVLGHIKIKGAEGVPYTAGVSYKQQPTEIATNKLAAEWGFSKPRGKTEFQVLVEQFNRRRENRSGRMIDHADDIMTEHAHRI